LRGLYAVVLGAVAVGGLTVIVDWARRGGELPGGAVPVTGRVLAERPSISGSLAMVDVAYEAGGKERRARLAVPGSDEDPGEATYRPGDPIPLVVSRANPDRVQHASWNSGAAPATGIPGWLVAGAALVVLAPLLLPGPRRRLQAAAEVALKSGGGRGI
jgi:hypothetical protein